MTRSRLPLVLIASTVWVGIVSAKMIHFADRVRDPGVKSWIRYQVIGPINSPRMPLYLTARTIKPWLGEQQVVLSPARYDVVSSFTQARMARSDCPGDKALANEWYTVQIAEYGKEHPQQCVLPQRSGCEYLSDLVQLHGIKWTATELRLITGFMAQARCQIYRTQAAVGSPLGLPALTSGMELRRRWRRVGTALLFPTLPVAPSAVVSVALGPPHWLAKQLVLARLLGPWPGLPERPRQLGWLLD